MKTGQTLSTIFALILCYFAMNQADAEPTKPAAKVPSTAPLGSPVRVNGRLHVQGVNLYNENGNAIQLRGMSTHGIQWYGWDKFLTPAALDALSKQWKADIVRVSLYVQEGGYETNPAAFTAHAEQIIDEVIARGMYVLVDWHMLDPGDPMANVESAKTYFTEISQRYANLPNVLYEIANEPNGTYEEGEDNPHRVDWQRIKSYAEQIIPIIRTAAPDSIVIVGTPEWASFGAAEGFSPKEVYRDPVDAKNIMYSFHFYTASHGEAYRRTLEEASEHLPVFVTEWGTQEATGDGENNFVSAQAFLDIMARKKISWINWNFSDDELSGAAFVQGTGLKGGPYIGATLKPAGKWVFDQFKTPVSEPKQGLKGTVGINKEL